MKRKILAALLTLVMVFSLLPVSAWAEETTYSDVAGHWAQSAILRWSDYGVLQGSEGKFSPDGTLTRGQMAVILSRLLNLPAAPSAGFTDVAPDAWYADGINRCAAAGILQGSEGKAMPEDPITREQAMVMLCRALGIAAEDVGVLAAFSDVSLASDYARPYVAALVKAGVVKGDANGLLNPLSKITRAEIVTMIDRLVGHYAKEAGAFVDASDGALVIVVAENVKIVNAPAGTKVIVTEKATGLTVNGAAVSADQTYIVPEEETKPTQPTKPSGGTIVRPEHRHSYVIKFDQNYHWEGCDCGATRNKTKHTWTEKVTTEPTCTEVGEKTFTCVCGETKKEAIPATGHDWGEYEVTTAATCTQPGVMTSTCSNCGGTQTKDIPATGHDFSNNGICKCGEKVPEVVAMETAWSQMNQALTGITGNGDQQLVTAAQNGTEYTLLLNVDAIQSGSQAFGDDLLNGLATKLKTALDAQFGDYELTVAGQKVYSEKAFNNTALKNALFSVADGFFYNLGKMKVEDGVYTYKTVDAKVQGENTYAFTIAVQLKGEDVAKVQALAKKLAEHLAMEKLTKAEIETRYGIQVPETEAAVVTVEMPDALMNAAAGILKNKTAAEVQSTFDGAPVSAYLSIMRSIGLSNVLGSNADNVNSVLATVNHNANAVNKVLSKLTATVTPKTGNSAAFVMSFNPGTTGDAWEDFMAGVIGMTGNKGIGAMTPSQFKVAEGQYKDVYYAVPVTVTVDLESSMGFRAEETVVVVLHVDFSKYIPTTVTP